MQQLSGIIALQTMKQRQQIIAVCKHFEEKSFIDFIIWICALKALLYSLSNRFLQHQMSYHNVLIIYFLVN